MLFGNESISHYTKENIATWMLMAFQAGILNIGGFMACHRFVSHVTGFATFFGHEMILGQYSQAAGMLAVPVFFLLGAMLSGVLVDLRLKLHKKPKYYLSFGLIFFLLLIVLTGGLLNFYGAFGHPVNTLGDYVLLMLLCFICGIQNGTITSVSKSVIRTTHLTGITTDLGIGIIRLINRSKINESMENEEKATYMRIGIIAFFGLGSVIGGFFFLKFEYLGFILPTVTSGCLFMAMVYFQLIKKKAGA